MPNVFRATVYDPQGQVVVRQFKGKPVPNGELVIERASPERAWLTARGIPDKPTDWPVGVVIKVEELHKPVPGTGLQVPPSLCFERKWDGEHWIDVATGEPV
jgi:hypothetical protein